MHEFFRHDSDPPATGHNLPTVSKNSRRIWATVSGRVDLLPFCLNFLLVGMADIIQPSARNGYYFLQPLTRPSHFTSNHYPRTLDFQHLTCYFCTGK